MTQTIDQLAGELEAWCEANNLPFVSADELISRDVTAEQRAWLEQFLDRWEAADTGSLAFEDALGDDDQGDSGETDDVAA